MLTIPQLRTVIREMTLVARACRANPRFCMDDFEYPADDAHPCRTPMCIAGHAKHVLGLEWWLPEVIASRLHLPHRWARHLFVGFGQQILTVEKTGLAPWWIYNYGVDLDERCLRAFENVIAFRRRQLAVLEVESGGWGRQLPARDLPVGIEREKQVLADVLDALAQDAEVAHAQ